ncbi:MAG: type II toxin-antitoxin system HipA family toxin [Bacilli bacterium]|nr:type II toxin-antitoxin system HipA family toxin [Bacilli bacterium]
MNTTVEIFLWNRRIGILHQEVNKPYATFEYDKEFINSNIEVFPLKMKLSKNIYQFPLLTDAPFYGLPGLVSDSLPDKFGNDLIESWLATQGKSITEFTAIDRLCYIGARGMGALEYKPSTNNIGNIDEIVNVKKMVEFASDILNKRQSIILNANEKLTYSQFIQVGTSAGGARAKAVIAWNEKTNEIRSGQILLNNDFDYWLMKFDNVSNNGDYGLKNDPQYTLVEYAYYLMAKDAGINMNECRIFKDGKYNHFMTKRFDRVNGKKVHMLSLGAMTHINYNNPGECSYEYAAQCMKQIGLSAVEIQQFFRRMVFNVLAVNQDDHVKNISFLMDKNGKWSLSPAYDLTFSYNPKSKWLRQHQMSINNKLDNITVNDLVEAGKNMEIKKSTCLNIIEEVKKVVNNFETYSKKAGVNDITIQEIKKILNNAFIQ